MLKKLSKLFSFVIFVTIISNFFFTYSFAQRIIPIEENEKRAKQKNSFSVRQKLKKAKKYFVKEDYEKAIEITNSMLKNEKIKIFDKASILEIRASCFASIDPSNYDAAISDYRRILQMDVFDNKGNNKIIYKLAFLYFLVGDYDNAIKYMKFWIENSEGKKQDAYNILMGAYVAKEDFNNAKQIIEEAIPWPYRLNKSTAELANYIYFKTDDVEKRKDLLEKMKNRWPDEKKIWYQQFNDLSINRKPLPLVRIAPQYPDRCQSRAAEKETVSFRFDVTAEGSVDNVEVIDTTNSCFNSVAIRSVKKWKYIPKLVDGKAVPRRGLKSNLIFIWNY